MSTVFLGGVGQRDGPPGRRYPVNVIDAHLNNNVTIHVPDFCVARSACPNLCFVYKQPLPDYVSQRIRPLGTCLYL